MQSLSSKMFSPRLLRYYSTQSALKLWVKHNGGPSTQVPINECTNIDDFAEKVKQKLNTNFQVALFSSLEKEAHDPGLTIKERLKTKEAKKNSSKIPLFVKLIPASLDSIATKTIYIGETDDDGKFKGEYKRRILRNSDDLKTVIKNADGLIHMSSPDDVLISFDDIKDGEKYQLYNVSQTFHSWQKNEADAMEAETLLSMMAFLKGKFQALPINLSTDFFDEKGRQIQEWDGVLLSKDALYLLEAKHVMTVEKINAITEKVNQFPKMIERYPQKEFDVKYCKIVGVACGTLFPVGCRKEAHRLGLMVMYPSGSRYALEKKYIIE